MLNMKRSNFLIISFVFLYIFFSSYLLVSPAAAQRGRGGKACGQGCVDDTECMVGTSCSNGQCYQTGCNPAAGDSACCKSQRPRNPSSPTAVPPGGGVIVPPPGATTPGTVVPPGKGVTPDTGLLTPKVPMTPPVGGGTVADCSGPVEGTKDGLVDLFDFNLLRKEFSGSVATVMCDYDTNKVVDLLDFNILRIALNAQK